MSLCSKLLVVSAFLLILFSVSIPWVNASSEDLATLGITRAEETLALAYEVVLEAEQAGANVSGLLDRLNIAGAHLAEAHMLFRLGDFEGSVHSADLLIDQVGGNFMNEAEKLKIDAQESGSEIWFTNIIISVGGVIAVISGTGIAWLIFKRRHFSTGVEDRRGDKT